MINKKLLVASITIALVAFVHQISFAQLTKLKTEKCFVSDSLKAGIISTSKLFSTGQTQFDSLHVLNKIRIGNSIWLGGVQQPGNNDFFTDDADLFIQSNDIYPFNTFINKDNDGMVGIGFGATFPPFPASPSAKFHVAVVNKNQSGFKLHKQTCTKTEIIADPANCLKGIMTVTKTAQDISGIETLFVIQDTGNVGVGTDSPLAKLHVNGAAIVGSLNPFQNLIINEISGNVGIGTNSPQEKLHVFGTGKFENGIGDGVSLGYNSVNAFLDGFDSNPAGGGNRLLINFYSGHDIILAARTSVGADFDAQQNVILSTNPTSKAQVGGLVQTSGNHTDYKFSVDGKVVARKYVATEVNWADDELAKKLTLDSLEKEEDFTLAFGYLYGIPSGLEVDKSGIDFAQMSSLQMRKIERLYLYSFLFNRAINSLNKENTNLQIENESLKENNRKMQKKLDEINKQLSALEKSWEINI